MKTAVEGMKRLLLGLVAPLIAIGVGATPVLAATATEPMYANDTTVFMSVPAGAGSLSDSNAQDFYLIAYPTLPTNGQAPLCDFSCPGPSGIPQVRDVVLEGAPGFGTSGTAGSFNPNWHVLALVYSPAWVTSPAFVPAKSGAEVDAGETAGHFLPIAGSGAVNPFELDTGIVFLCVLVSSHA